MAKRYLALAMLASALWGISYPITYLALRLYSVTQLLTLTYLLSVLVLSIMVVMRRYDIRSVIIGLLISPINYVLSYLYIEMSGYVGGLTALVSSSYVIPLILLDYLGDGSVDFRHAISAATLLASLYLLFRGYADSIDIALLLMVLNLIYTVILSRVGEADTLDLVFGQSLGTLLISLAIARHINITSCLNIPCIYYPILLALVGNVIPYSLYALSIKNIGPTEASLTTSVEVASSLLASIPLQPLPTNPVAWVLLAVSMLSISIDVRSNAGHGLALTVSQGKGVKGLLDQYVQRGDEACLVYGVGATVPRRCLRSMMVMLGKRKVI